MNTNSTRSLLALGLFASSLLPVGAAQPNADQILRQMSASIGGAQNFSFTAHRQIDAALTGKALPSDAAVEISVMRPDKIKAVSTSKNDIRHIVADGTRLTLVDQKKKFYATVPMKTSIDGLVERLDEKYGFTPPLAEFVVSNPYGELRNQAAKVSYLGEATFRSGFLGLQGVTCHRLGLSGRIADAELWVGVKDHLPRKLNATFKDRPGQPKLKVEFTRWNLAAKLAPSDFAFTPPAGGMKIEMKTSSKR